MAPAATMDSDSSIDQLFGDDIAPYVACGTLHSDAAVAIGCGGWH